MSNNEEMTLLEIMELDGAEKTLAFMELGTGIVTTSLEAVEKAKEAMDKLVSYVSSITDKGKNSELAQIDKLLARIEKIKKEEKEKEEEKAAKEESDIRQAYKLIEKRLEDYKREENELREQNKALTERISSQTLKIEQLREGLEHAKEVIRNQGVYTYQEDMSPSFRRRF